MKTKFSKRILSLFLAVMMVVTSIPMFAMTASAAGNKYLFTYFTGNSEYGQRINFALSTDGVNFNPLNGNQPILKNEVGLSKGVRDPYIFKGNDNAYYMLATDGDYSHNNWSDVQHSLIVYKSSDLINWTQTLIDFNTVLENNGISGSVVRAWAPEAIYDSSKGKYMVYLSLAINDSNVDEYNSNKYVLYYSYTSDLTDVSKYEAPHVLYNPGYTVIDGDIAFNPADNLYYLYFKDERDNAISAPNGKRILYTTSSTLNSGYSNNATRFNSDNKGQEGCNSYFVGDDLYMIVDYYGDGQFYIFKSTGDTNFKSFTKVGNINNCSARHGSIISITDEQYNALANYDFLKINENSNAIYTWSKENFVTSGGDWKGGIDDGSGHTYDLAIEGSQVGVGSNGYVKVGSGEVTVYAGNININDSKVRGIVQREDFSVRFSHRRNGNTLGNQNIAADGTVFNIAKANTTEYYLRVSESGQLTVNVNGEYKTAQSSVSIPVNQYQDFLIKYDGQKTELYIDGVKAAVVEGTMTARPGDCFTALGFCDAIKSGGNIVRGHASFKNLAFYGSTDWFKISTDKVSEFESKVKSISTDKIYTNIGNAYNAYVLYNKAKDSYYYGQNTDVDMGYYQYNLDREVDSMKQISNGIVSANYTLQWNANGAHSDQTVDTNYYRNILWANKTATYPSAYDNSYMNHKLVANDSVVMLYDGTAPRFPLVIEMERTTGTALGKSKLAALYLNGAANFELKTNWLGYTTDWTIWPNVTSTSLNYQYSKGTYITYDWSNNTSRLFKNYAEYTGTGNTTDYYDTITSLPARLHYNDGTKKDFNKKTIADYVLNYQPLKAQLTSKYTDAVKNKIVEIAPNIANYKEGGAAGILAIADCLVDPTAYDYSSNTASVVQEVAGLLKAKTEKLQGLSVTATATTDSTNYRNLRTELDNSNIDYENYTADSTNQYDAIVTASRTLMADVLANGYIYPDRAELDVTAIQNVLNSILDKSALQAEIANKDNPVIFDESGNQTKTYASWKTVYSALKAAKLLDETVTNRYSTETGNYANVTQTDLKYNKTTTDNTQAVTDATTNLQNANLVDIDTVGYPSFDAAKTVVDSIDRAKYTTSALLSFDSDKNDAYNSVYYTPTADEISAYNDNTEGTDITGDLKISTSLTNTDAATIALLNAVNTLNTVNEDGTQPNVNKYSAKIYDSDRDYKETISKYYGDTFKYNVGETLEDGDVVTWVVTVYANDTDLEKATAAEPDPTVKPIRSQVVSNYNGITIERTANGSMCIQYIIDKGTAVDQLTYKIYNAYGNVIDVLYGSEGAYDDAYFRANYPDPVLPFYTFKEWSVSVADNGMVKVKPVFDETPTKTVTVDTNYATISFNKMSGGNAVVGATATITGNSENIYGWAVATGGKYQIVGYGKDYKFNVFADESYVPIIKTESGYQINGTDLTANMVAGFSNNSNGNLSDDAYLAAKLTAKAPFVYYQTNSDFYDKGVSKTKVYVRITAGSGIDNLAYGLQINGNKFVSTAKNEGGQFYMTMKTASYNGVTENNMSAYVSYTFPYTFKDETAYITTIDYAKIK